MRLKLLFDNNSQSVITADWVFQALNEDKEKCLIICTNNGTFMASNIENINIDELLENLLHNGFTDLTACGPVHSTRIRRAELED